MADIYVYYCYGGSHSSVTAAAIHVGLLNPRKIPSNQVILSLPYYDTQKGHDHGVLQFVGTDQNGCLVFSVGLETSALPVIKAVRNLLSIARLETRHLKFIETLSAVNFWMKIGGICSRLFGLKSMGRPMVLYGTKLAYYNIAALVKRAREGDTSEGAQ